MAPTTGKELRIAMRAEQYNKNCSIQNAAMKAALELLPSFSDKHDITIIDYGCSQGVNSIEPIRNVLSTLPTGASASLIFEDTPFNDFSTLSQTITGHLPTLASTSNLQIFPSLVPIGFFNQVIPTASADLALSWSSFSYLESKPTVTLDPTAPPSAFAIARQKALATAAHPDLVKLLELRAKEVKPGGYLVAAIGGNKSPSETAKGESNPGAAPLQMAMMQMVAAGKLTFTELALCALWPSHERTPEEIQAVLETPSVAALWEPEVVDAKLIAHPAWYVYQDEISGLGDDETKKTEAYTRYADAVIRGLVSASGWFWAETIRNCRGIGEGKWKEEDELLEEMITLAVQAYVEKFKDMKSEIWYNYLRLRRKTST